VNAKELPMSLPIIQRCEVTSCFFNTNQACHAPAITVGNTHPACDTFTSTPNHTARKDTGAVGACHITDCRYNDAMLCTAPEIVVLGHSGHADCGTYQHR
jgi:hypothetical protein